MINFYAQTCTVKLCYYTAFTQIAQLSQFRSRCSTMKSNGYNVKFVYRYTVSSELCFVLILSTVLFEN